ncbi:hypothetical protein PILCRDRAFT_814066 [Piloderma croceum F 1598]|uniref:Uncharacterized protein n=1 Tax=Piloderma croceum (strain F 1598) TaxID=765440 RepID=A0A0C3CEK8_PILCF|nr:hypothetical protein PILCRDRAFT_814066 [Piloderma croceum F 1598]
MNKTTSAANAKPNSVTEPLEVAQNDHQTPASTLTTVTSNSYIKDTSSGHESTSGCCSLSVSLDESRRERAFLLIENAVLTFVHAN